MLRYSFLILLYAFLCLANDGDRSKRQSIVNVRRVNKCPYDKEVAINPTTGQPQFCIITVPNCPLGSRCTAESNSRGVLTGWCCRDGPETVEETYGCPASQSALISESTNEPQTCSQDDDTSCPLAFGCYYSLKQRDYICCGKQFGCPHNSAGYINPQTGGPESCVLDNSDACAKGFECAVSRTTSQPICCSTTVQTENSGKCPYGVPLPNRRCDILAGCPRGYECYASRQGRHCCPKPITVCNMPLQPGDALNCGDGEESKPGRRFYFDPSVGTCRPFNYAGCSSNANSFEDLNHCEMFCYPGMCSYGTPLRQGGLNQLCGDFANTCPPTHMCVPPMFGPAASRVCCPTPSHICGLDLDFGIPCDNGPAKNSVRFWYNRRMGRCQQFQYAGCDGNDNNFERVVDCTNFWRNAFRGGMDPDILVQSSRRTGRCQQFQYAGCDGNDNNFERVVDCNNFCRNAFRGGNGP